MKTLPAPPRNELYSKFPEEIEDGHKVLTTWGSRDGSVVRLEGCKKVWPDEALKKLSLERIRNNTSTWPVIETH